VQQRAPPWCDLSADGWSLDVRSATTASQHDRLMHMPRYRLRLEFEWGGGCLWCDSYAARERFDVGPVEEQLPLPKELLARLDELSRWHDQALDWSDPPAPSPWSQEESNAFDSAAQIVLGQLRSALGDEFVITYERL
jgi:hypothetical protein